MDSFGLNLPEPAWDYGSFAQDTTLPTAPDQAPPVPTQPVSAPGTAPAPLPVQAPLLVPGSLGPVVSAPVPVQAPALTPLENGHTLGLTVLLTGIGTTLGIMYGGLYGGAGGALAGGSIVNLIRAYRRATLGTPEDDKEATISATYGVLGLVGAVYLISKSKLVKKDSDKHDTQDLPLKKPSKSKSNRLQGVR